MECWIIIIVQEKKCLVDLTLREKSSRSEVFSKKVVLRNFVKFTGKHLCQFLFLNKVVGMRPATLLKKRLWHRCFPVNFDRFFKIPVWRKTSGRLLLNLQWLQWIQLFSPPHPLFGNFFDYLNTKSQDFTYFMFTHTIYCKCARYPQVSKSLF